MVTLGFLTTVSVRLANIMAVKVSEFDLTTDDEVAVETSLSAAITTVGVGVGVSPMTVSGRGERSVPVGRLA